MRSVFQKPTSIAQPVQRPEARESARPTSPPVLQEDDLVQERGNDFDIQAHAGDKRRADGEPTGQPAQKVVLTLNIATPDGRLEQHEVVNHMPLPNTGAAVPGGASGDGFFSLEPQEIREARLKAGHSRSVLDQALGLPFPGTLAEAVEDIDRLLGKEALREGGAIVEKGRDRHGAFGMALEKHARHWSGEQRDGAEAATRARVEAVCAKWLPDCAKGLSDWIDMLLAETQPPEPESAPRVETAALTQQDIKAALDVVDEPLKRRGSKARLELGRKDPAAIGTACGAYVQLGGEALATKLALKALGGAIKDREAAPEHAGHMLKAVRSYLPADEDDWPEEIVDFCAFDSLCDILATADLRTRAGGLAGEDLDVLSDACCHLTASGREAQAARVAVESLLGAILQADSTPDSRHLCLQQLNDFVPASDSWPDDLAELGRECRARLALPGEAELMERLPPALPA